MDLDAVFRPGIDTTFSSTTFDDLSTEGSVENPIVLDKEEDKENAPLSTPVSEHPTEAPRLLKIRAFGARVKSIPEHVYRNLFQ